jgi:uncharacterized protein YukE
MRRLLIVLTVLIALVAAGCGGGGDKHASKDDYGEQLAQAGQTLQKTFADISDQTGSGTSAKEIATRLDRGAAALDQAAKRFADIQPPSDVKSAHQKLVDGLEELAGVFRQGATAARKNDTANLTKSLQGLSTSDGVKKITEAQQELKAKGIQVTSTGK